MSTLNVWYGSTLVGRLRVENEQARFAYDKAWASTGFPISVHLPLREDDFVAPTFFSNLLPEGVLREAICNRLHISYDNDFELLAAIGGECAGSTGA